MAGTQYVNMNGRVKYCNSQYGGLFEQDAEYGNYKVNFYPDPEEWEKLKRSGSKLEAKNDEDGDYVILRRPHEKMIKGEMQTLGRPKVFFTPELADKATRNIGNGSRARVSIAVYGEPRYRGTRLESVTITELVEYEGGGGSGRGVEFKDGKNDPVERQKNIDTEGAQEEKGKPFNDELPFDAEGSKPVNKPVRKPTPFKR